MLLAGLEINTPLPSVEGRDVKPKRLRSEDTAPPSSTGVDSRIGLRAVTRRDVRVGLRSEDESSWAKRLNADISLEEGSIND